VKRHLNFVLLVLVILVLSLARPVAAQFGGLTLPPNGDNQHAIVIQYIGPVKLSIDYNSPDVHAPDGSDRHGKIWGTLVPYGLANLNFGPCGDKCPWRGGANENTSNDVKVQGQPLKAGAYGLHFIPGETEWTIIFSNNSTSWGSFTYDSKEDALRVTAKPQKNEYHEWLTYEFTDRQPEKATVALMWEDLQLPFTITVDNISDLYIENMANELRSGKGFTWQSWDAAAQYCLQSKSHLDLGLKWAETAVSSPFYGQENVTTLITLSMLQEANGQKAEAAKTLDKALNHYTAGPIEIHTYARGLQAQKKPEDANKVFELNAKRFPNQWPTEVGLARVYSAKGDYKEALKHAQIALKQAPTEPDRKNVENIIKTLEQGKNIN
jgi:tetratricopeptide (TPR) repeat protein